MFNVDFKITTWKKISINSDVDESILQKIREDVASGKLNNHDQIDEYVDPEDYNCENIDDVEEMMTVEENSGNPVVEIHES